MAGKRDALGSSDTFAFWCKSQRSVRWSCMHCPHRPILDEQLWPLTSTINNQISDEVEEVR
jgi:hypothetical protein